MLPPLKSQDYSIAIQSEDTRNFLGRLLVLRQGQAFVLRAADPQLAADDPPNVCVEVDYHLT